MRWSRRSGARFARVVCVVMFGLGLGCDGGGDDGGAGTTAGGTGGAGTGTGGAASGTGGATGTGGAVSGTGGSASGTGGEVATGTGGASSGSGGAPGTGGSASGTGGSGGAMCSACVDLPLSWGMTGGLVAYTEMSAFAPCGHYAHMRTEEQTTGEPSALCENDAPCEGSGVVTPGQIQAAVDHEDVQAAVQDETLFGVDNRPADSPIFELRVGYQTVLVGDPCAGQPSCVAIPPAVQTLVDLLQQLDEQQLAEPPCQGLFE